MRRISAPFAIAAIILIVAVGITYKLRVDAVRAHHVAPTPQIAPVLDAIANHGWNYTKDDPQTNRPIVRVSAASFEAAHDPSAIGLHDVRLRLFDKAGDQYTFVHSESASFDEGSNIMKSHGTVNIVMNVPANENAENPADAAKLVQVQTSGVIYNTQTGSAQCDQPASFHFPSGDGSATGVSYDPATRELVLKSGVSLNWVGKGPVTDKLHVEAGTLLYRELEHKVYLSPWSKLVRQGTTIDAKNSVVTLDEDGALQRVDALDAAGVDIRDDKETRYKAGLITADFDDDGALTQIDAVGNANVVSQDSNARTTLTSDRATLHFNVTRSLVNGATVTDSELQAVTAEGHAVAEAVPVPQPGVTPPETRILRSEHIDLFMNPDGKNIHALQAPVKAQLEFRPNSSDQSHRVIDASSLHAVYGDGSYIQSLDASNAVTHTERPRSIKPNAPASPPQAVTSSDRLTATFEPASNHVHFIHQSGRFQYQEGKRQASADDATLDQLTNTIKLSGKAHVGDDTGSTSAAKIVMNQTSGDMEAQEHVVSIRLPDAAQKPGTSMLDTTRVLEAKADQMTSRDDNTDVVYTGHAIAWQGANRVSANRIEINRDDKTLHATGNVVSELVDDRKSSDASSAPVFSNVTAPELQYRDDLRLADYTGGVKLTRADMTVTAKELKAYLTPKSQPSGKDAPAGGKPDGDDQSSLDYAVADGDVVVSTVLANNTLRKGVGEHCEYYAKTGKVILNGGAPQLTDSRKGITKGRQLTYFSNDDKLIVEGEKKQLAYTQMKK